MSNNKDGKNYYQRAQFQVLLGDEIYTFNRVPEGLSNKRRTFPADPATVVDIYPNGVMSVSCVKKLGSHMFVVRAANRQRAPNDQIHVFAYKPNNYLTDLIEETLVKTGHDVIVRGKRGRPSDEAVKKAAYAIMVFQHRVTKAVYVKYTLAQDGNEVGSALHSLIKNRVTAKSNEKRKEVLKFIEQNGLTTDMRHWDCWKQASKQGQKEARQHVLDLTMEYSGKGHFVLNSVNC